MLRSQQGERSQEEEAEESQVYQDLEKEAE